MRGYLLDTNIISYWFDEQSLQNRSIVERIRDLPGETPLRISAISLGEIEFGFRVRREEDAEFERELRRFLQEKLPTVLDVTSTTRTYYGSIRASLFDRYTPRRKLNKQLRLGQLTDPVSELELGIQENDVWIAAQAIEYNLVLVSNDKLTKIRDVADGLFLENWVRDVPDNQT
ncbi:MAG: PIN domain-containing protein [Thermoanaerobaculia bacterium]